MHVMVHELNHADWDAQVVGSPLPVLVDFYSTYCPPCRTLAPILERVAADFEGRARVVKVNSEENISVASALHVTAVPTVVVFRNGKEVGRVVGLRSEAVYRKMLEHSPAR
jgi:thioredoxin 1